MTTLDDAAERRCQELARHVRWIYTHPSAAKFDEDIAIYQAVRDIWIEATEAAAKKCDAQQSGILNNAIDRTWNRACNYCAAAIRGKGG